MTQPRNTLRQRRELLGYTQEAFAPLVGVTARTVRQWEKGERVPQLSRRRPLAAALGLDMAGVAELYREIEADHVAYLAGRAIPSDEGDAQPPVGSAQR